MTHQIIEDILEAGILESRDQRVTEFMSKFDKIMSMVEKKALYWTRMNLTRNVDLLIIKSFTLPLKPVLRAAFRDFYDAAYTDGSRRAKLTPLPMQKNRLRAKADLAFEDFTSRLELELRSEWNKIMGRGVDLEIMRQATADIFSSSMGRRDNA